MKVLSVNRSLVQLLVRSSPVFMLKHLLKCFAPVPPKHGKHLRSKTLGLIILGLFLLAGFKPARLKAQVQDDQWSETYPLSSKDGVLISQGAAMVADSYGFVHVFWIEEKQFDRVIMYARFDGDDWTKPVDIFATPNTSPIGDDISVSIDHESRLHLTWAGGFKGPVVYSTALSYDALSAHNWQRPTVIKFPAYRARIAADSKGVLHMLYTEFYTEQLGVYYARSEDHGETWSNPSWLDPDIPPNHGPNVLQFAIDDADGLHATWYYTPLQGSEPSNWIRYIHSPDSGKTWSAPVTIDKDKNGLSEISLPHPGMVVNGRTVHVIWAGGDLTYRRHLVSTDAGETWGEPSYKIFGDLLGQAQGDGLAVDGAGRLHFIGQIRWPQGLYHAYWDQNQWSVPSLAYLIARDAFDPIGERIHAHGVRLAIRAGNQLVTTFYDRSDTNPAILYAMNHTLDDIPASPVDPIPVITPGEEVMPSPVSMAETEQTTSPIVLDNSSDLTTFNPGYSIWLGIIPVTILLGVLFGIRLFSKRYNNS